jgi:hypothetical protein
MFQMIPREDNSDFYCPTGRTGGVRPKLPADVLSQEYVLIGGMESQVGEALISGM